MLNLPRATGLVLPPLRAVVIGASAGGVAALDKILPVLPAETPFPVAIVLHVSRVGPSALVDIFSRRCAVAVREAIDKEPAAGGTVWFAPPDYHLLIEVSGTFALSIEGPVNFSRPAVDPLFESAAIAYGPGLVGIILTGSGQDGARGAMAVSEAGGWVVVEDPACAESPQMPATAIAHARPDAIGSATEIGEMLRSAANARVQ